jgi:hypothetical protein
MSLMAGAQNRATSPLHLARVVTAIGHHHVAPRRQRAQPRASTHADERAWGGTTTSSSRPPWAAAAAGALVRLSDG